MINEVKNTHQFGEHTIDKRGVFKEDKAVVYSARIKVNFFLRFFVEDKVLEDYGEWISKQAIDMIIDQGKGVSAAVIQAIDNGIFKKKSDLKYLMEIDERDFIYSKNNHKSEQKRLVLNAVTYSGYALEYVPKDLLTTEMGLAAVTQHGLALKYVPEDLRTTEIYLAAVTQNGVSSSTSHPR